ncbi:hypothetical protein CGH02_24180 [Vibrio parahaemolyticus]|uniref:hypothetical protein n=1 Tax=Vibrio parahaemolyticus TaxID=670 RepID=UPI0009435E0C|nr:hypothetical protein [Vibrio parahaemolyticus]EGQ7714458.1 hypothetical protein [Vibrio parahaemolyticus]EGQ7719318.1 hypothetical protein [Vibrio parahaemolyticus]EGQ7723115.1 hypothetical protein [Vibrio parahaemolyticus]EGQ7728184.1 hypothetical protein [Vibrio parahaemolyticus]EGQ7734324.1 hypothetical protein [Vibrio parahaemolyticus]
MQHNKMPSNHQSNVSKKISADQIDLRFKLMEAIVSKDHHLEINDEIIKALESNKALFCFSGVVDGVSLDSGLDKFQPITRNTVKSHGKLARMQLRREEAFSSLNISTEDDSDTTSMHLNLTIEQELEGQKELELRLTSELASVRSAYRELLKVVKNKLPFDPDIESIVRLHNQSSIMRKGVSMKVVK